MGLRPIWRCLPNGNGVGALALDPEEAAFVLERGFALLDGERWRVNLDGSDTHADLEGRILVRIIREHAPEPHGWEMVA